MPKWDDVGCHRATKGDRSENANNLTSGWPVHGHQKACERNAPDQIDEPSLVG